jgi:hypothetical protein
MSSHDVDAVADSKKPFELHPGLLEFVHRMSVRGVVARYEVRHIVIGSGENRVGSVDVEPGQEPEEIAENVQHMMHDDADSFGGEQLYTVLCYRAGEPKYFMRRQVRLWGQGSEDRDGIIATSEPPNAQGLLAQTQRHVEVVMRIGVEAMLGLRKENTREIERSQRRVEHLEDQRDAVAKMMSELQAGKTKQEIELVRAQREDRQHELTYKMLDLAVPAMMGKLLPQGAGAPPRDSDKLREFLLGISPLQMQKIVQWLNPAQVMALDGLITAYKKGQAPSFGDTIVERFLDSLQGEQVAALERELREDQVNMLAEISKSYWEARQKQGGEKANGAALATPGEGAPS